MSVAATQSTRDRLIDAALEVVAREGLEASVKAIAAEAGVAPGLLHYHFATKDELLEAALLRAAAAYEARLAALQAHTPAHALVEKLIADAQRGAADDAMFYRLRLAFAVSALTDPRRAEIAREVTARAIAALADTLAVGRGRTRPNAADRKQASVLKALFDGAMLNAMLNDDFPLGEAGAFAAAALHVRDTQT